MHNKLREDCMYISEDELPHQSQTHIKLVVVAWS